MKGARDYNVTYEPHAITTRPSSQHILCRLFILVYVFLFIIAAFDWSSSQEMILWLWVECDILEGYVLVKITGLLRRNDNTRSHPEPGPPKHDTNLLSSPTFPSPQQPDQHAASAIKEILPVVTEMPASQIRNIHTPHKAPDVALRTSTVLYPAKA